MTGIKISKKIRDALPREERAGLEEFLWDRSAGFCHLCARMMNRATDDIEPDHDSPDAEGGATCRDNLNLAHESCNRAKRNYPTVDVRPWLKLKAFAHERGGVVKIPTSSSTSNMPLRSRTLNGRAATSKPNGICLTATL